MNGEPGAPRQRWRLVVGLPASTVAGERPAGIRSWADALQAAGLPLAAGAGGRGLRITQAAPLPLGIAGEREVVDIYLSERLPIAEARARLVAALPAGVTLVDLHDVWLGAIAAPAAVRGAEYRLDAQGAPRAAVEAAVARLLAARSLPRERRRERRTVPYDLRPLVDRLEVSRWEDTEPGGPAGILVMRLRHTSDATGRPEEVLAALAEEIGTPLAVRSIVRERLLLDERPAGTSGG